MNTLFTTFQRFSIPLLRFSLGIVLLWIGALKFLDPGPVLGLLEASFSFLAFDAFVYLLGVFEITAALLLFAGKALHYVGLLLVGLFLGTLVIFLVAPAVAYGGNGFPYLSLAGEFLLKDLVLLSAAVAIVAAETARASSAEQEMVMGAGASSTAR